MNKPKISVVIPTYNEEKYLRDCLNSFQNQTFQNFEIIIVDGNSTDKTRGLAQEYNVKILEMPYRSICKQRDIGARQALAEIIVCADADTIYSPNHLLTIWEEFLKDRNILTVTGSASIINPPLWWKYVWIVVYYFIEKIYQLTGIITYAPGFNFSYRKRAFLDIGGYNLNLDFGGDELDILNRLKKKGKVVFLSNLKPITSNRSLKKGFFFFFFRQFLFYYWFNYISAKILGKAIIRAQVVR